MNNASVMRYRKPKGLVGRLQQLILQPILFFKSLPDQSESRSWFWAALLILILAGYSAVRRDAISAATSGTDGAVQARLILAIGATASIILSWLIQMLLLALATMLQGKKPIWSINFRIAIWASIPLLLMSIAQIVYMAIGGELISMAFLANESLASGTSDAITILLGNLLRQVSIFNLWRMVLFYLGASYSLNSPKWIAILLTVLSFASLFLLPTLWQISFLGS